MDADEWYVGKAASVYSVHSLSMPFFHNMAEAVLYIGPITYSGYTWGDRILFQKYRLGSLTASTLVVDAGKLAIIICNH